jgi:hypothetical protein
MTMRRTLRIASFAFVAVLATAATAASQELQNDTWSPGEPVEFQAGLITGEIAAARLIPPLGVCPCEVVSVEFLFGPSGTRNVTVRIWEDDAEELAPGDPLLTKVVSVASDPDTLKVVDVRDDDVVVDGPFRVGIVVQADGAPSVANDDDGTVSSDRNFLFSDGGWFDAAEIGLSGDWVIRARVAPIQETRCAQPVSDGNAPVASDCLFILRTAVGTADCDPGCVCDPNGSDTITASDALVCLKKAVGQSVTLDCPCP